MTMNGRKCDHAECPWTVCTRKDEPVTPRDPTPEELEQNRRTAAADARLSGQSWSEVAASVGYRNARAAFTAVNAWLREQAIRDAETAEELRRLEAARLDKLQAALWDNAMSGDVQSVDKILKVSDRRAKLFGLDAPAELKVDGAQTVRYEIKRSGTASSDTDE
jgi:hypothetical protein